MAAAGTYDSITTTTLNSSQSSVTLDSFSGYTDLILQISNQMDSASGLRIRFNSDTGSNYGQTHFIGHSTSTLGAQGSFGNTTSIHNNLVFGDSTGYNVFTPHIIQIQNYENTNMYKTILWRYGTLQNIDDNSDQGWIVGAWRNTNAITSIEVSAFNSTTIATNTSFTIYGIKKA
jgi:hypothetical protein